MKIGLGKKESFLIKSLMQEQKHIFTTKTAAKILKTRKTAVNEMLKELAKKGWLVRIRKGMYLVIPLEAGPESVYTEHSFIIASHLVEPCYVGFWSALNFHGLTEQIPSTAFIAAKKTMRNRKILGIKYRFIKIKPGKFFGSRKYFISGKPVHVSDREKTIADCLDRPDMCGGIPEIIKPFLTNEDIDYKKLVSYAKKMGGACLKRTGFVLEKLGLADASELQGKVNSGYVYLDTIAGKSGKHNSRWNVIENISLENLKKDAME